MRSDGLQRADSAFVALITFLMLLAACAGSSDELSEEAAQVCASMPMSTLAIMQTGQFDEDVDVFDDSVVTDNERRAVAARALFMPSQPIRLDDGTEVLFKEGEVDAAAKALFEESAGLDWFDEQCRYYAELKEVDIEPNLTGVVRTEFCVLNEKCRELRRGNVVIVVRDVDGRSVGVMKANPLNGSDIQLGVNTENLVFTLDDLPGLDAYIIDFGDLGEETVRAPAEDELLFDLAWDRTWGSS